MCNPSWIIQLIIIIMLSECVIYTSHFNTQRALFLSRTSSHLSTITLFSANHVRMSPSQAYNHHNWQHVNRQFHTICWNFFFLLPAQILLPSAMHVCLRMRVPVCMANWWQFIAFRTYNCIIASSKCCVHIMVSHAHRCNVRICHVHCASIHSQHSYCYSSTWLGWHVD